MSKSKVVGTHIHNLTEDEIRYAGYLQLQKLLTKLPMQRASEELMVTAPSLYRYMSDDIELEQVSLMLATHVILMCEGTERLQRILNERPMHNAYYQHPRHDVLAARKSNGKGES